MSALRSASTIAVMATAVLVTLHSPSSADAPWVNAADYESLDEAIAALPQQGGTVLIPPGRYVVRQTLNLSFARHNFPQFAVNLRGAGKLATVLVLDTNGQPGIDFTGNSYWSVSDLMIFNRSASVGVLLARTPPGQHASCGEFRNVYFGGCFPIACIYMTGAECCRFDNCSITNQLKKWYNADVEGMTEGEACVLISPDNVRGLKSPYCESTGGGSNTEFLFHGCTFSNEAAGSCGIKVIGYASDLRIVNSYLHSDGLAAVYLDGTKSLIGPVSLRDVRIEAEHGRHCVYVRGHTHGVTIDGGAWNSTFEPILQEEAASFTDEATAAAPTGSATNWRITGLSFCIWDGSALHPDYRAAMAELGYTAENTCWPDDKPYVFMRFARLIDSYIEPAMMVTLRFREDADGKPIMHDSFSCGDISAQIRKRWRLVSLGPDCAGNRIVVSQAEHAELLGAAAARNHVTVLNPAP